MVQLANTSKSALIIDDEEDIGRLLGYQLKKMGIRNDYAPTLEKGKTLNSTYTYNLIFLDINLPDGNGLDIIHELKETNDNTCIVVISAYNVEEDQQKAFELGADHFMGKPFNSEEVEALVNN